MASVYHYPILLHSLLKWCAVLLFPLLTLSACGDDETIYDEDDDNSDTEITTPGGDGGSDDDDGTSADIYSVIDGWEETEIEIGVAR